jgi:hypothetical protein
MVAKVAKKRFHGAKKKPNICPRVVGVRAFKDAGTRTGFVPQKQKQKQAPALLALKPCKSGLAALGRRVLFLILTN